MSVDFVRAVEVEKALRNAGGICVSLISAPARMGLFVRALPRHRPAAGIPPARACGGIPGSNPRDLCPCLAPQPSPGHEHHAQTQACAQGQIPKEGERAQLAQKAEKRSGSQFKMRLISFAPVGPGLCQGWSSRVVTQGSFVEGTRHELLRRKNNPSPN